MGQAFDKDGHIMAEFYGSTKREVFEKLMDAAPTAHEIRIRSGGALSEMPRYTCHKEVWALKISSIFRDQDFAPNEKRETDGSATIVPADTSYGPFKVSAEYLRKHNPQVGGYFVVYKDGYKSFSPEAAFEEGYTRI